LNSQFNTWQYVVVFVDPEGIQYFIICLRLGSSACRQCLMSFIRQTNFFIQPIWAHQNIKSLATISSPKSFL